MDTQLTRARYPHNESYSNKTDYIKDYIKRRTEKYYLHAYREAIADFTKVIEINPEDAAAYYGHGLA